MTANGTTTSPVLRGAWVLDRILGTPPPSRRWTSRPSSRTSAAPRRSASNWPSTGSVAACASCHVKIDPPGFALESFDVIGGWRDYYRSIGKGEPVIVDGRRMRYLKGPKVDAADVLPDGRRFREHRRVQATAAEGQGPARPRPGREAADLRHGRGARDGRSSRRSRRSSQASATRITASGRWFTRSCRARCFRTSNRSHDADRSRYSMPEDSPMKLTRRQLPPRRRRRRWPCPGSTPSPPARARPRRQPRRRMVCICTPLGLHPPYFFPEKAGKDYELTPYLEVLKDFRDDFTVISGLSHPGMSSGFAHQASASFLTGAPGAGRPGFRNAISLDQFAAEHIGGQTRFPSLALSGEGVGLSWTRTGALVPADTSPSQVFARLFLEGRPDEVAGPGAPSRRRPEHPRRRPRPGQDAAVRPRRRRPRQARRVLHQRPRAGAAAGPGRGLGEEAQAQGRCRAAQGHPQRGRPHRPDAAAVRPHPPGPADRFDPARHDHAGRHDLRAADPGRDAGPSRPVAPRQGPGQARAAQDRRSWRR